MARHDVVERQVVRLTAAVLAGVAVTTEDFAARQLHAWTRATDHVLEADHGRRAVFDPRRPHHLVIELDHLCLLTQRKARGRLQTLSGS